MEAFQHLKRSTRFKAIACLVNIPSWEVVVAGGDDKAPRIYRFHVLCFHFTSLLDGHLDYTQANCYVKYTSQ
jgi:hypothetical protein